jgi:hypothetical protein
MRIGRKVSKVVTCDVKSKGKTAKNQKKKKYNGQQQKEMDCDEPHLAPNEKTQPI